MLLRLTIAVASSALAVTTSLVMAQVPVGVPVVEAAATWAFEPARDDFSADSLLDLRGLNEKVAGQSGWVRVSKDGAFVRGDGAPLRFWAVNTDVGRQPFIKKPLGQAEAPDLHRHARFLAKRGVNMVRLHRQLSPDLSANPNAAITDINTVERDGIWRTVAAMRAEGIYTTISPYWAGPMRFSPQWGVQGDHAQPAWGLLFFDPVLQAGYKAWLRQLLTLPNPYTGVPLAKDPSVALIQIQNEDSLLFWTTDGIKGAQRAALEQRFGDFLRQRHGSIQQAVRRWGLLARIDVALRRGRPPLLNTWELIQPARDPQRAARQADQTEFLSRTMHDFNQMIVRYLRDELGAKQLVNAGNWKTASTERLNDAERWSYSAGEVDAANFYTGGQHEGPYNGWAIVRGDTFSSDSVLREPWRLPVALKQGVGRPMLVTEGNWVMPNAYGAEGPFLIAAYSSLLGIDGYYWFATDEEGWKAPGSANGYLPSQGKWLFGTPEILGSFPAAAMAFRSGYLARGEPYLRERRTFSELWSQQSPSIVEPSSFDPNRDTGQGSVTFSPNVTDPVAFLTGPVVTEIDSGPRKQSPRLTGNPSAARAIANTGQIVLDSSLGYCSIDAPHVQGVAAHFVNAPEHRLSNVRIRSKNAFGAAIVVSLDGKPLSTSRRLLAQFATQSRPTGWRQTPVQLGSQSDASAPQRFRVDDVGSAPWRVVSAQTLIDVANPGLTRATVLDMNGRAIDDLGITRSPSGISFAFPTNAMYVLLR
jgi:hypothetical protein